MRFVVVSLVGLWAAACNVSPEQEARDLCTAVCNCQTASPAKVTACIEECTPDVPALPDECVTCVYEYSQTCGDLYTHCFDRNRAAPCTVSQPQPNTP